MIDRAISTQGLSLGDFIRKYDEDGPFELINGEVVPMSPTVMRHNKIMMNLVWLLMQHVKPNQLGVVFSEAPFVLEDTKDWVSGSRVPDVMFIRQARFETYKETQPDWENKPLILVPDLAIEIVSPNDRYSKINHKVELYLDDGVKLVWVVDPQRKKVAIHTANIAQQINLKVDDTLTGGAVIPDFEVSLTDIFA